MKTLFACLFALSAPLSAALKEDIATIRRDYALIESGQGLTGELLLKSQDDDPEGFELKCWRDKTGALRKQVVRYAGDHGEQVQRTYFKEGRPFFIFVSDASWHFIPGEDAMENARTADVLREERHYFVGGRCVRSLEKSVTMTEDKGSGAARLKKAENQAMANFASAERHYREAMAMKGGETEEGSQGTAMSRPWRAA